MNTHTYGELLTNAEYYVKQNPRYVKSCRQFYEDHGYLTASQVNKLNRSLSSETKKRPMHTGYASQLYGTVSRALGFVPARLPLGENQICVNEANYTYDFNNIRPIPILEQEFYDGTERVEIYSYNSKKIKVTRLYDSETGTYRATVSVKIDVGDLSYFRPVDTIDSSTAIAIDFHRYGRVCD